MTMIIDGTNGLTFPDSSQQYNSYYGFKNRIINGAMVIDQRNAGASVTITNTAAATYVVDRWAGYGSVASKFSLQQNAGSVTPPAGYTNYLGATSLSAYSVAAGEIFVLLQNIEGFNAADLAWGTANAATVTLSFWVRSSLTGTFGGALRNSADTRSYPFTYTISSANTWEQKTITVPGDTTGTWLTNNGVGISVSWGLGVGSTFSGTAGAWAGANYQSATGAVSVVGTNGATFYITGVQLEKGSTATSFDYRPYGTELALCQRYFISYGGDQSYERFAVGQCTSTTAGNVMTFMPVQMRASPTITTSGSFAVLTAAAAVTGTSAPTLDQASTKTVTLSFSGSSGLTAGNATTMFANNSTATRLQFSSEL